MKNVYKKQFGVTASELRSIPQLFHVMEWFRKNRMDAILEKLQVHQPQFHSKCRLCTITILTFCFLCAEWAVQLIKEMSEFQAIMQIMIRAGAVTTRSVDVLVYLLDIWARERATKDYLQQNQKKLVDEVADKFGTHKIEPNPFAYL